MRALAQPPRAAGVAPTTSRPCHRPRRTRIAPRATPDERDVRDLLARDRSMVGLSADDLVAAAEREQR